MNHQARKVEKLLRAPWVDFNAQLLRPSEKAIAAALQIERRERRPRLQYLLRLHQRLNKLRGERERTELYVKFVRGFLRKPNRG